MVSCSNCREAHTACSDERPCARCVNIGKAHSCVDAVSRKRGRRPRTALTPPAAGQQADPQQPQQQQLSLSSPTLRSPTFALPSASTFTSIVTPGGQQDSRSSFSTSPFFIAAPIPTQLSYSCSPSPLASPAGKGGGSGGTSSDGTGGSRRAPPGPALSFRPTYFGPSPSLASSALALSSASSSASNKQQGHKAKHKRTRSNPTTGGGRKEITNTEDSFDVSNDDPSTTGTKPQPEQTRHESYSSNPEEQHKVAKMVSTFEQHPPRHHNKQNDSSGEGDSLYPHHQMHLPPHPHSHTTKQHAPRPQNQHRVRQQQAQRPTPSGTMDPERERQNFVASLMLRFNAALKENSDALASRMERKVQESKREVELLREELRELKNLLLSTAASAISAGATSSSSSASSRHHHMAHDLGMDPPRSGNTSLKVSFGPSSIASSSLSSSNRRNESSYWSNHFDEMEIMGSSGTSAFSSLFSSTDREEPLSPRPLFSSTVPSFWPATPPNSDFGGAALPPISSASCPSSSSSFASSSSSSSSLPHHHSDVSTSFSSSSSQPTIDLCSFLCSSLSTCSPFLPSAGSTSSASASFSTSSSSFSSTTSSSSDQLANMGEAFGRIPSHMQKPFLMMVHSVGVSKIVNVNDSYCKLLKINPEDLVGQPSFILRSFLPPQHRFMVDPEIIPLFERHTTFYDCYRAIILAQARDGSHLQMDSAYHTFYGVTGLPSWTILIVEGVKLLTGSIQGIPPSIVLIRPKSCNSSNSLPSISWQPQRQQEGERDGDGEDGEGDGESSSSSSQDQRHQRQHHHGHLESILQSDDYSSQTDLVGNNVSNPNVVSSSSTSPISTSPLNLQQQSTSFSSSPTSSSTSSCPTSPSFVFPSQLSSMSAATSSSSSSCSSSASTSSSTSTLASAASQQHACKEGALETDMTSSSTNNDTNHNQSLPSSHSRGTRDPSSSSPSSSSPPPSSSSSPSSSGFNHQNPQRLFFSQQHTSITSSSIEDIINKQLRSASASISSVSSSSASFMVGGQEAGGATPPAGSCASCTTPIPNSPEPFSIFYQL